MIAPATQTKADPLARPFSYFEKVKDKKPTEKTTLEELVKDIRSDRWKLDVERSRATLRDEGKDAYKALRAGEKEDIPGIPAVLLSALVATRAKGTTDEEKQAAFSGLLQIDLDNLGDQLPRIRRIVEQAPFIAACWVSISGTGLKAVARIPATKNAVRGSHQAAADYFAKLGITIDPLPKSPWSPCFISHDPDAYFNPEATELEPIDIPHDSEGFDKTGDPGNSLLNLAPHQPVECVREALRHIKEVDEYETWTKVLRGLRHDFRANPEQGLELFDEWSSTGSKYGGTTTTRRKWNSFTPDAPSGKPVTIGTVFHLAKQGGWNPGGGFTEQEHAPTGRLTDKSLSDAGNAERLQQACWGNLRFVWGPDQWIIWEEGRWNPDRSGRIRSLFIQVMRATAKDAMDLDSDRAQAVTKFALASANRPRIESGTFLARSLSGMTIQADDLDADPMLLGTPSGTIDLRTGEPIEALREHLITKRIAVDHDPEATCPRWLAFLSQVTGGDRELEAYLKKAVGYMLTGSVDEQCLFFLYGKGNNGKGVFSETIQSLWKDYAQTAPEALFVKDRSGNTPMHEIARLVGCRMATAAELDEGTAFAESRLKALTGGDRIVAREHYKSSFDFAPTHKFWISGNHKPTIRGTDEGIWRRIRLIPFTVTIPKKNRDRRLKEKLAEDLPGILNWALEGCLEWQREGLTTPACVTRATAEYRSAEDVLGQFLAERTTENPDARTKTADLYAAYEAWAKEEGIRFPLTRHKLGKALTERGFPQVKIAGHFHWRGLEMQCVEDSLVGL